MDRHVRRHPQRQQATTIHCEEIVMTRDIILWLAGVPLVVIIGLHLFGFLH
jgi:hypothetical protein